LAYFQTKHPILGKFCHGRCCSIFGYFIYLTGIWYILRPFGILYKYLVYFGMLYQYKSGNSYWGKNSKKFSTHKIEKLGTPLDTINIEKKYCKIGK
jgi:hypothetical protein